MFLELTIVVHNTPVKQIVNTNNISCITSSSIEVIGRKDVTGTLILMNDNKSILECLEGYEWFKEELKSNQCWTNESNI
jgi:hypothetical protein